MVAKVFHKTSLYYNVLLLLIRSNDSFEFISEIEERIILLLEKESQFEKKHKFYNEPMAMVISTENISQSNCGQK